MKYVGTLRYRPINLDYMFHFQTQDRYSEHEANGAYIYIYIYVSIYIYIFF